jgi:hypothetical protein
MQIGICILQLQVSVKQLVPWNHAILTTKKGCIFQQKFFFEQPTEVFHIALLFVENA